MTHQRGEERRVGERQTGHPDLLRSTGAAEHPYVGHIMAWQ